MYKIPQCFVDKINLDDGIKEIKTYPVIPFETFRKLKSLQATARLRCIRITSYDTTGPTGTAGAMIG